MYVQSTESTTNPQKKWWWGTHHTHVFFRELNNKQDLVLFFGSKFERITNITHVFSKHRINNKSQNRIGGGGRITHTCNSFICEMSNKQDLVSFFLLEI
jgi:hypothetical protein